MPQPPIRIYFEGCEGSGKTTLARSVAQQYGLSLLTEVASAVLYEFQQRVGERSSSFERIRADVALSTEVQERVFQRQLDDEKALPPPAVYDRTLSCLAYAELYANNYASLLSRVPAEYVDNLRQSIVFLVRPQRGLAATSDGARAAVTWENQIRIDQTIEVLFQTWDVKFVSIDMLNAAARQRLIDWCLAARGFKKP
jgi:predicted ATPase